MFESGVDQAYGLRLLSPLIPTRVLPLVQVEGSSASSLLMRAIRSGFSALGYSVASVEGVHTLQPEDALLGHARVLHRWLKGVPQGTVVILHAPLEALAVLLADSLARPLLTMGADKHSTVAAYNSVKVLVQAGGLQPVVLQSSGLPLDARRRAAIALQDTCRRQFSLLPPVWELAYDEIGELLDASASEACLFKLLDSALTLDDIQENSQDDTRPEHRQSPHEPLAGVSDVHGQRHA